MSSMAVRMFFFCVVLNTLYHNTSHRLSIITVKQFVMSDCCSSPISDCIHGFFSETEIAAKLYHCFTL